jgi:hypothetical protein
MTTAQVVWLLIGLILIAAVIYVAVRFGMQSTGLRNRFGPEYDRVLADAGSRQAGEAELRRRQKAHSALNLRPLTDDQRARYRDRWLAVQQQFVQDPVAAVQQADRTVAGLITDLGYPEGKFTDRLAHLSVEHSPVLGDYREARGISERTADGSATTEQLRQALVQYRTLLSHLLGEDLGQDTPHDQVRADATPPQAVAPAEPDVRNDSRSVG